MILCGKRYIVGASLLNKLNRHRRFVLRPLFSELSLQWKSQSILSLHESAQYWINQKKRQFYPGPWVPIEQVEWLWYKWWNSNWIDWTQLSTFELILTNQQRSWSINNALQCTDNKWGMGIWNWLFVCIKLILNELSISEQSTKVLINQCNGYEGRLIRAMEAWMNNYQEPMLLPGEEIVIFSSLPIFSFYSNIEHYRLQFPKMNNIFVSV